MGSSKSCLITFDSRVSPKEWKLHEHLCSLPACETSYSGVQLSNRKRRLDIKHDTNRDLAPQILLAEDP